MKSLMSKMVEAINHISLLNERQQVFATTIQRIDERLGRMEAKQHEADIATALQGNMTSRVESLERAVREQHVAHERDKARQQTLVWALQGVWAVLVAGIGIWLKFV